MLLNDIKPISIALKTAKTEKIKLLHSLIFEIDGGRKNRHQIRNFSGFDFEKPSEDYESKLKFINDTFTVNQLITIANLLYLSFEGNKSEIADRILFSLCNISELMISAGSNSSASDSESDYDKINDSSLLENETSFSKQCQANSVLGNKNETSSTSNVHKNENSENMSKMYNNEGTGNNFSVHGNRINALCPTISFNYSDLESTVSKFCAESHENIVSWLENFEINCDLFGLSDFQKFIFAKRSLGGNAALFVRTEPNITSWKKLKHSLITEFSFKINSANLHSILNSRRMRDDETVREYFLKMKEISVNGKIDENALMHYIIHGIQDKPENKVILYGCQNLIEFKEKLNIYEIMRNDSAECTNRAFNRNKSRNVYSVENKYDSYCFNESKSNSGFGSSKNDYYGNKQNSNYYDKGKLKPKVFNTDVVPRYNYENRSTHETGDKMKYSEYRGTQKVCYNCGERNHISRFCMHKNKGLKCFSCGIFGHRASECAKANNKPEIENSNQSINHAVSTQNLILKVAKLQSLNLVSLIDTGSQRTLLKQSTFEKLKEVNLRTTTVTLTGLGNSRIKPIGYFQTEIEVDDFMFQTDVFVVNDQSISFDLIIGADLINQGTLTISGNEVKITKTETEPHNFLINAVNVLEDSEIDVSPIKNSNLPSELFHLIKDHIPVETKSVDVTMKIILTDKLKEERNRVADSLTVVNSEKTSLDSHDKELMSQLTLLQSANKSKDAIIIKLKKEVANAKKNHEGQIKELENKILKVIDSLSNEKIKNAELENSMKMLNIKISQVCNENRKITNLRRKKATKLKSNNVVAIKHHGSDLKLKSQYLCSHKVVKTKVNDTYDVQRIEFSEGPRVTNMCAENMKPWPD